MSLCSPPNCPCSTNPYANLSSEDPDRPIWVGVAWAREIPLMGAQWTGVDGAGSCLSEVSQYDADLCADRVAEEDIPPTNPISRFCNVLQGCQGQGRTVIVVPCTVVARTQSDADAIAASICQEQLRTGGGTPDVPGCPVITSMFPASPAQVDEGMGVLFQVNYTYTGAGPLSFTWYLDGLPLAFTSVPTFTIDPAAISDSGTYTVEIFSPDCPSILSTPVILEVVATCYQGGTPVPEFLYSSLEEPIGTFVVPPDGSDVSCGILPKSVVLVRYTGGAWASPNNPCPLPFVPAKILQINFVTPTESQDLLDGTSFCGSSQAEIESIMFGLNPPAYITDHSFHTLSNDTGGECHFNSGLDAGYSSTGFFPTFDVSMVDLTTHFKDQYILSDFATNGPGLMNQAWIDTDGSMVAWNGVIGGAVSDQTTDTYVVRATEAAGCGSLLTIGGKGFQYVAIEGPLLGQDIANTLDAEFPDNPEFENFGTNLLASGELVSGKRYWSFYTYDCCHPGCEPGLYGWYGVKGYGADLDGFYKCIYRSSADHPACIEIT